MAITKTPIYCSNCGEFIGYIEDFSMSALQYMNGGIRCWKCGKAIFNNGILCKNTITNNNLFYSGGKYEQHT